MYDRDAPSAALLHVQPRLPVCAHDSTRCDGVLSATGEWGEDLPCDDRSAHNDCIHARRDGEYTTDLGGCPVIR